MEAGGLWSEFWGIAQRTDRGCGRRGKKIKIFKSPNLGGDKSSEATWGHPWTCPEPGGVWDGGAGRAGGWPSPGGWQQSLGQRAAPWGSWHHPARAGARTGTPGARAGPGGTSPGPGLAGPGHAAVTRAGRSHQCPLPDPEVTGTAGRAGSGPGLGGFGAFPRQVGPGGAHGAEAASSATEGASENPPNLNSSTEHEEIRFPFWG